MTLNENNFSLLYKLKESSVEIESEIQVGITTYLNPFSYVMARKRKDLFSRFDFIHSDGIALSLALRLIGCKNKRKSFDYTSMAPEIFEKCASKKLKIALVGSEENFVHAAAKNFRERYGESLNISYVRNGFFLDDHEKIACINEIIEKKSDVVIVGMGTPLQEEFLVRLVNAGWIGAGYTCGGFFHQTAASLSGGDYYPKWIDRFNLRWLYRMYDEPKLIKRYAVYYPEFAFKFFVDYFLLKTREFYKK